jgi:hypothetical protein
VQVRLGLFEGASVGEGAAAASNPWAELDEQSVGSPAHQELALQAAQQSHVLLKNLGGTTLPLSAASVAAAGAPVVLIGPCLEVSKGGYSQGGSQGRYTGTTAAAIGSYLGDNHSVTVVAGCGVPDPEGTMGKRKPSPVDCPADPRALALAVRAAARPGAVVLVAVGIDGSFEGENGDYRAIVGDIGLPGGQGALVAAVAAAAAKPITVLVTGSSVDLTEVKRNPKVGAILWRGYAGEAAGRATADVLFGAMNPSGRLTSTFYPADFVTAWKPGVDPYTGGVSPPANASFFDHTFRPNATTGNPGRTHRFYAGATAPAYTFGAGMSYTSFGYELLSERKPTVPIGAIAGYAGEATARGGVFRRDSALAGTAHVVVVRVTNTGRVVGAHTVLSFVSAPNAGTDGAPLRSLAAFDKVLLEPGEGAEVSLRLSRHDLTLAQPAGGLAAMAGRWRVKVGEPAEVEVILTVE